MLAATRLRHVAGTMWGKRRNHLRLPRRGAEHHIQQSCTSDNVHQTQYATRQLGIIRNLDGNAFQRPLLPEGTVPVNPTASKEAVMYHALANQKKDDCQNDYKY